MTAERDRNPPEEWAGKRIEGEITGGANSDEERQGFKVNDRRHWVEGVDDDEAEEARQRLDKPAYVQTLEDELKQKDETLREYISQYKSAKNNMNEAVARIEREKNREVNFRVAELARTFLSILDDLTAATKAAETSDDVEAIRKGLELIAQRISSSLSKINIEPIRALGEKLNPEIHEAVGIQDVDDPEKDDVVIEELKPGYMMGDVLVRPASVVVGKYPENKAE